MATAAEARAYLTQKYKISKDNGDFISLVWQYEDGRTQQLVIQIREDSLVLSSPIAKVGEVTADQILKISTTVFGLGLVDEHYVLSHFILLENADPNEIDIPLGALAVAADELEEALGLGDVY